MISGFILKRSETDYVVNCDEQGNGGYTRFEIQLGD